MRDAGRHIIKARAHLRLGHFDLGGEFTDAAGRAAYMAAFHAALAFIVSRTGKEPKTHMGAHGEFARVAREDGRIPHEYVAFLSQSYGLKTLSDYADEQPVTIAEATAALELATKVVDAIAALIEAPRA